MISYDSIYDLHTIGRKDFFINQQFKTGRAYIKINSKGDE